MNRARAQAAQSRFPPLSTGVKLLLALALALLPLGVVAIVASIETANVARENSDSESRVLAEVAGRRLSSTIARTAFTVRAAMAATRTAAPNCRDVLTALANIQQFQLHVAIYHANGALACQSDGYPAPVVPPPPREAGIHVRLDQPSGSLRFMLVTPGGRTGLAEIPASALRSVAEPLRPIANYQLTLSQAGDEFVIRDWGEPPSANIETVQTTLADRSIVSRFTFERTAVRPIATLSILLPLIMLVVAAVLAWFIVSRLLLKPLARLDRAVSGYRAGDESFTAPAMDKAAFELRRLGDSFDNLVSTTRDHEHELEAGIAEQMRLTREVHHRVKNNLQVISSLLSLHARGARTSEIAAAYASIQRRVEALAIVQRNLFAEAEAARGVAVRPVLAELASGLQQTAPEAARVIISLNIADVRVAQDTAVPVAFLVTELVELAMLADGDAGIAISVEERESETGRAELRIASPALAGGRARSDGERYNRVLNGLARQLRAPLEHDPETGDHAIRITVLDERR